MVKLIIWFYFVLLTSIPLFLKKSEDYFQVYFTDSVCSFELCQHVKGLPLIPLGDG